MYCKSSIFSIFLLFATLLMPQTGVAAEPKSSFPDIDPVAAEKMLSEMPLSGPEGLWTFDPDEVCLMILKNKHISGQYDIFVVDAVDCRLTPGMNIGLLEETIDKNQLKISLKSRWKNNVLDMPLEGVARLDNKTDVLRIEGKSAKLSVTPSIVLPNLLSLLRLRIRLNLNNPNEKLPSGLRRVYPRSNYLPSSPIYL